MTNAVFMPYVLVANRPVIEAKIARLAAYCGLAASFDAFLAHVLALRQALGVPHTLPEFKVDAARRDQIAEMAVVDPTAGGNPVPVTREFALEIFDRASEGRV
jgi:alcohol dehydrogenase